MTFLPYVAPARLVSTSLLPCKNCALVICSQHLQAILGCLVTTSNSLEVQYLPWRRGPSILPIYVSIHNKSINFNRNLVFLLHAHIQHSSKQESQLDGCRRRKPAAGLNGACTRRGVSPWNMNRRMEARLCLTGWLSSRLSVLCFPHFVLLVPLFCMYSVYD